MFYLVVSRIGFRLHAVSLVLKLSTARKCVFILKELIRYYIEHGSCMYVTYLDASKAFDRVNHQKLFAKLIEGGAPRWCIRILCHWYCNQLLCVRWESVVSDFFPVNNGVRQGGIMSPLLFNFYVNDLKVSNFRNCQLDAVVVIW